MNYLVGAFQNKKNGDILFNPSVKDDKGINTATNHIITLKSPFDWLQLITALKEAFTICEASKYEFTKWNVPQALGYKTPGSFTKDFYNVTIYKLQDKKEYYISPLKRYGSRGGYIGEKDDKKFQLDFNVSDEELGETIIKAFSYCR